MKRLLLAALWATTLLPAFGSAIESTSVSCAVQGQTFLSVSAPTQCSLAGNYGVSVPLASASVVAIFPDTFGGDSFSASIVVSAFAQPGATTLPIAEANLVADASASASWSITADTGGPVRDGFIELSAPGFFDSESGTGAYWSQVGPYDTEFGNSGELIPFTLGEPFTVSLMATASIEGVADFGGGDTVMDSLSFELFEADGVTPVQFFATPEPGSLMLVAAGLAFGCLRRRNRLSAGAAHRA